MLFEMKAEEPLSTVFAAIEEADVRRCQRRGRLMVVVGRKEGRWLKFNIQQRRSRVPAEFELTWQIHEYLRLDD